MPKSKKPTRKRGNKSSLSKSNAAKRPGFDPGQSRLPSGLKPRRRVGGKPKLFPGRTGGR